METEAHPSFAVLLKGYRLAHGLTQEALAEAAGLSRDGINLLERGARRSPRRDTVTLLALALKLPSAERARLLAAASEGRTTAAAARGADSPSALPSRLTSFIGREREIAEVRELVLAKRLLTLTGPGGIGKTSLGLEVAASVRAQFADGVALVELGALTDGELVPHVVTAALGVREQAGEPILATVGRALGMTRRLLVLDNCEHLVEACARVVETLLRTCPQLTILATSREPLRVGPEVIWRVPAFTLPQDANRPLVELAQSEAVRLFVERAGMVRPGFVLTVANAAAVGEICRRLDGIPLALELAAARVAALSPAQIARHLDERFRLLSSGSRTAPPRQQTLRATLDWSYDLLSPSERMLFQRLAVFGGGFTLEAAERVLAAGSSVVEDEERMTPFPSSGPQCPAPSTRIVVLDLLARLCDKSLVLVEEWDGEARYRLLETLREYAHERLAASGQAEELREAHAAFFLSVAEQRPATDHPSHDRWFLDLLEVEHENLRAALQWFANRGDVERGLRLSSALAIFWFVRGHFAEGRRWFDDQLAGSADVSPVVRATALEMAAQMAFGRGDLEVAAAFAREGVALWRQLGDRRHLADLLYQLGQTSRNQRRYPDAVAALEESVQIHQEYGDQFMVAVGLFQLGVVARQQSDFARARSLLDRALIIQRALGDPRTLGITVFHLGLVAEEEGNYSEAQSLYEQSLTTLHQVGDRREVAFLLDAFASLSVLLGQYRRGACLSGAATALRQQIGVTIPPPLEPWIDRTQRLSRDALGEAVFAQCWAEGQAMTGEQAVAFAREELAG